MNPEYGVLAHNLYIPIFKVNVSWRVAICSSLFSISSPSSVGVKLDTVEMLKVGEEAGGGGCASHNTTKWLG